MISKILPSNQHYMIAVNCISTFVRDMTAIRSLFYTQWLAGFIMD